MITNEQRSELISEFSELVDPETDLLKEVYAHCGLLFFMFASVEHSLINALTLHYVGVELARKRIRTTKNWEDANDRGYEEAKSKTFGNLVRAISAAPEFVSLVDELKEIKGYRDYFAHHFFREEGGIYGCEEGRWHVLWLVKQLRDQLGALDKKLTTAFEQLCGRIGISFSQEELFQLGSTEFREETQARLETGQPFQWYKAVK